MFGALWPEWFASRVGARVTATAVQEIGIGLLAASVVYFALLWWLKPGGASPTANGQRTHGHSSPSIGTAESIVINYAAPPPAVTQERKQALNPDRYNQRALDGLARALGAQSAPTYPPGLARYVIKPKPDLPLNGVLIRVYLALGPIPKDNLEKAKFWRRVNLEIADKVVAEELHTWGRFGDRALAPIPLDKWEEGKFDHKRAALRVPVAYSEGYDLTELHFFKSEVERIWPAPLKDQQ